MQFPMIMGGVVPVVNIEGVAAGKLKLSGAVLADIYLGKITKWNDPAIPKLNPGVNLPDRAITVVHRSDGSGTTFIFTHYLSEVSADWKTKVGRGRLGRLARRRRRQGQRGRRLLRRPHQRRHRLRRVRLRAAEQARLHPARKPGRQVRRPEQRVVPGRRGQRRLGARPRLLPAADQPAGRRQLADHRRQLHPDVQAARRSPTWPRRCWSSSTGPTRTAAEWPASWTTCRCRTSVVKLVESAWATQIKDSAGARSGRAPCSPHRTRAERVCHDHGILRGGGAAPVAAPAALSRRRM